MAQIRLLGLQVVPILRAGLVLLEQAATLLPACETYHLGYVRDDETLQVSIVPFAFEVKPSVMQQPGHLDCSCAQPQPDVYPYMLSLLTLLNCTAQLYEMSTLPP